MRRIMTLAFASVLALGIAGCGDGGASSDSADSADTAKSAEAADNEEKVLNLYSSRHYDTDTELIDKFTEETGIKVNVVESKGPELVERLINEKADAQADLLVTVGAESIYQLNQEEILAPYNSSVVDENVPEEFRGDNWAAIAYRARVIAYVKDQVDPESIKTYDDITKPEWKGQVLARSSENSYNQALLSSFVQLNGSDKAKEWAKGVVDNFGREPDGNDREQAVAITEGQGKLAIMNSYYYVKMANNDEEPKQKEAAKKIGLIFPEDTHINLSYAGVVKGAKHPGNAAKFMEFLTSDEAQQIIAKSNGEFPVNPKTEVPEPQKSWLGFTPQKVDFEKLGESLPESAKIFTEVGWK